jgi:hypothetical protein
VFEVSAKTGQGMDAWRDFSVKRCREHKQLNPLA